MNTGEWVKRYNSSSSFLTREHLFIDYKEEQDGEVETLKAIYTEEEFKGTVLV